MQNVNLQILNEPLSVWGGKSVANTLGFTAYTPGILNLCGLKELPSQRYYQIPTKLIVSTFLMFLRIFYNKLLYLENLFELLEVNL